MDEGRSAAWINLASWLENTEGGQGGHLRFTTVNQRTYTPLGCLQRAVECELCNSMVWCLLAQRIPSDIDCDDPESYKDNDPHGAPAVEVAGQTYNELECYVKAIEIQPDNHAAWKSLKVLLQNDFYSGAKVCILGETYTQATIPIEKTRVSGLLRRPTSNTVEGRLVLY